MKIESTRDIPSSTGAKVGAAALNLLTGDFVGLIADAASITANVLAKTKAVPEIQLDPNQLLKNLCLPEETVTLLKPALKGLGYTIESDEEKIEDPFTGEKRPITIIKNRSWYGWCAHIDKSILDDDDPKNTTPMTALMYIFREVFSRSDRLFLFSTDLDRPELTFDYMIEDALKNKDIDTRFIAWRHITRLQSLAQKDPIQFVKKVKRVFLLEKSQLALKDPDNEQKKPNVKSKAEDQTNYVSEQEKSMSAVRELDPKHIGKIVEIMAEEARVSQDGPEDYFQNLVRNTTLTPKFKDQRQHGWSSNPYNNGRALVDWALAKGGNPADPKFTTLGSFLQVLLPTLGVEDSRWITTFIVAYRLYRDNVLIEDLATNYGIPLGVKAGKGESVDFGPDIDWQGPQEEVELQGWFTPEPDYQDVGFLMNAIRRASSVCRIEFDESKRTGTGVLIGKRHVLTNYHVLRDETEPDDALKTNAQNAILRFGKTTEASGQEAEGREFRLVADQPVLKASPVNQLDYVLLQVEDSIQYVQEGKDKEIEPAPFTLDLPYEKMELHILQHPGGESMKLAQSGDGVVKVLEGRGLVQYATRALGGSSGSPCFRDNWDVIALHHAQRSKRVGTIREGIIFRAIHEEIKECLK